MEPAEASPSHRHKAAVCASGAHCQSCRAKTADGAEFRRSLFGDARHECEFGVPWDIGAGRAEKVLRMLQIGSKVEAVTKALGIKPKPGCGCKKRKALLNGDWG